MSAYQIVVPAMVRWGNYDENARRVEAVARALLDAGYDPEDLAAAFAECAMADEAARVVEDPEGVPLAVIKEGR